MFRKFKTLLALACILAAPAIAFACLWDHDTLKQERARFPSVLELITGKFLRHSKDFYEWRIKDRKQKLAEDPTNLAYHDDLAVAYQKTGQQALAIETMLAKEKLSPDLYETHSNLGTFYILAGDFEKGLPYIDKALAINPDAHFGREKYQKWLVEYALEHRRDGRLLFPLRFSYEEAKTEGKTEGGFREFVAQKLEKDYLSQEDAQPAITGVLGMMRFADFTNPLLLEALGDLLGSPGEPGGDAKQLAARAYLQASYQVEDSAAKEKFRKLAQGSIQMHEGLSLSKLEDDFKQELADAERWYKAVKEKEQTWTSADEPVDVEQEFDRLYSEEPPVVLGHSGLTYGLLAVATGVVVFGAIAVVVILTRWRKKPTQAVRISV